MVVGSNPDTLTYIFKCSDSFNVITALQLQSKRPHAVDSSAEGSWALVTSVKATR